MEESEAKTTSNSHETNDKQQEDEEEDDNDDNNDEQGANNYTNEEKPIVQSAVDAIQLCSQVLKLTLDVISGVGNATPPPHAHTRAEDRKSVV
mgnify:CR=1 FL=1